MKRAFTRWVLITITQYLLAKCGNLYFENQVKYSVDDKSTIANILQ